MSDPGARQSGYRATLRHPVAGRLLLAKGISELGDFVGLAALLLLAYAETDSVLGPAAVFAARTLPALAVAVLGGWLDVPPRRSALVWLSVAGGVLISIPAIAPNAVAAIIAAGLLGAVRAAYRSVHMAVVAESVDATIRLPFFGLVFFSNQVAQVVGIVSGAAVTLTLGARWALIADAVSFGVTALIFAGLPVVEQRRRGPRPPASEGLRIIWRHPVLRVVAIVTCATMISTTLPEVLAADLAPAPWVPAVMAGSALGGGIFAVVVARGEFLRRVGNQLAVAVGLGLALALGAAVVAAHASTWALMLANALVGAGGGWLVGAQATFAQYSPPERMGQVEATIVAINIVVSGAGVLLLGWIADAVGPAAAYLAGSVAVLAAAGACWRAVAVEQVQPATETA